MNIALPDWMRALPDNLQRGFLRFIGNGLPQRQYYGIERTQGKLGCLFRQWLHYYSSIYVDLQATTAWMDFTAMAEVGVDAGFELQVFVTADADMPCNGRIFQVSGRLQGISILN